MSAHYSDEEPHLPRLQRARLEPTRRTVPGTCDGSGIELARTVTFDWEPDPLMRDVVRPYPPRTDREGPGGSR